MRIKQWNRWCETIKIWRACDFKTLKWKRQWRHTKHHTARWIREWGNYFTGSTPTKESSKRHSAYACRQHTEAKEVQQKESECSTQKQQWGEKQRVMERRKKKQYRHRAELRRQVALNHNQQKEDRSHWNVKSFNSELNKPKVVISLYWKLKSSKSSNNSIHWLIQRTIYCNNIDSGRNF